MAQVYIGTSGWQYNHWKKAFYPQDLPKKDWLRYYAKYFDTVEVNATFYHQMKPATFENWRRTVGPDFTFAIKGSRFITHIKRLKDCQDEVERFFEAAGGLRLGGALRSPRQAGGAPRAPVKMGISKIVARRPSLEVILWQLPPGWKANEERLKEFLQTIHAVSGWRQAFEFRDKSWFTPEIYSLLKDFNCALVIADSPYWPKVEVATADFVYLRFHGKESLYASCYTKAELDLWAKKMRQWLKEGFDVYGYFNNDAQGYAIQNAKELKERVET